MLEEIDFVAAYIIPLDLWYIIPAGVVAMRKGSIWLAPWKRQSKYERYLEAWHLLRRWRHGPYAGNAGKRQLECERRDESGIRCLRAEGGQREAVQRELEKSSAGTVRT